jgi:hypothetical protein
MQLYTRGEFDRRKLYQKGENSESGEWLVGICKKCSSQPSNFHCERIVRSNPQETYLTAPAPKILG